MNPEASDMAQECLLNILEALGFLTDDMMPDPSASLSPEEFLQAIQAYIEENNITNPQELLAALAATCMEPER